MALYVSKDKLETQEVTLSGLLRLCEDCKLFCLQKTERVIDNRSRAPRGWEKEYLDVATQRRSEDYDTCFDACNLLNRSCPAVSRVEQYDLHQEQSEALRNNHTAASPTKPQEVAKPAKRGWFGFGKSSGEEPVKPIDVAQLPSAQEVARCENAAERFAKILFAIAHKPSKVHFDAINPKTGEKMEGDKTAVVQAPEPVSGKVHPNEPSPPPGRNEGKRADSKALNDEILRRWSTSRRERRNMEELGVIRTNEETQQIKQELQKQKSMELSSGTMPKWEKE
jgi:hypothetical protein